ncbi:sugar ABC transporter permease [Paenibacillus sp. PR3]|uniref:Sugar ABC transporter permease n=1 Tax=Paenibacillus terricola TaxID=2763503 RepID=A0ABR8MTY1_9BACL|nr:sugar ABC transporter permease [Paenibacillus terricola]MBD3919418.1 sugar ABC transporter permease [Paenibacillus terricola]
MVTTTTRRRAAEGSKSLSLRLNYRTQRYLFIYLMLSIPLLYFLLTRLFPILYSFNISFREWDILSPEKPFVGLDNYYGLFEDEAFRKSLKNTFFYVVVGIPGQLAVGLFAALLLQNVKLLRGFFRTIYFIPYITSIVAVSWVFRWLLMPNGWINGQILNLGLPAQPFLQSPDQAPYVIALSMIWQSVGFQMLIFLTGLEGIPKMYHEAAHIDGANAWDRFRFITLPLLNPIILFSAVIAGISYLQSFAHIVSMTQDGGPLNSTRTLVYHIYKLAFKNFDMGSASAATVILFVIILAFTLLQLKLLNRKIDY